MEDLKIILAEIEKLGGHLKAIPEVKPQESEKALRFEEVVAMVEMILERSLDRNMKLYQFQYQYKLAVKRAEEMSKQAEKWQK